MIPSRLALPRIGPVAIFTLFLAAVLGLLLVTACATPTPTPTPTPDLTVAITTPDHDLATNASVTIEVSVTGGTPEAVWLLRNDAPMTQLTAPYDYSWDTTITVEGEYVLMAEATVGSRAFRSDPVTITVDRTAPTVIDRSPAPGADNVSAWSDMVATFSEAILASSVTDITVQLTSAGSRVLTKTLELSSDARTLTITPTALPSVPNTLTVTFTSGITDAAGNALIVPGDVWSFLLPAWLRLGEGLSATPGATDAEAPSLVVHNRAPVVAWSEEDGNGTRDIFVRRGLKGGGWEALGGGLSANAGETDASFPSLAIDSSGTPSVAWHESDDTALNIYVRRWSGTAWEPVGDFLSANPEVTHARTPSLAIDNFDTPIVAWAESDGTALNIYVRRWNGTSWEPVGSMLSANPEVTHAELPSLALHNRAPYVAWAESDGTADNVYVRRGLKDGTWDSLGGVISANPGETDAYRASLVIDDGGTPYVTWNEENSTGNYNVYVRRWTGLSWESVGSLPSANPSESGAWNPSLAIDGSGTPYVAWAESDGTARNIYVRRWSGTSWDPLGGALSASVGNTRARRPSLAIDSDDMPIVAWQEFDGTARNIYVRRWNQ